MEFKRRVGESDRGAQFIDAVSAGDMIARISADDNSLIVEENSMKHFDTLNGKGMKEPKPEFLRLIHLASTSDTNVYHWPCGNADLAIVDFKTLEYDLVPTFFGQDPSMIPLSIKSAQNGRKVLALMCSKTTGQTILIYWNKVQGQEKAIIVKPTKAVDPKGRTPIIKYP